jgi:hypothetical protein
MSWISLDQLVVPVALTSFVVAVSMLMPAAEGRGIGLPPATWSPAALPAGAPRPTPGVDEPLRSDPPTRSFAGSRAGVSAAARTNPSAIPYATMTAGQLAGTAPDPAPGRASGSAAAGAPGRRGVAGASVPAGPGRRRGRASGASSALGLVVPAAAPARPPAQIPRLRAPVPGRLLRGFDAPASPYGPGHRGVDLAAGSGIPVTAPAPGRVRFAGQVGGTGWVSIEVATGVTVSVGPIANFQVRAGDDVGVLTVLGEAAEGHGGAVHLGMRVHGEYVDPQPYLATFGPPRLVPLEPPDRGQEQRPRRAPRSVPGRVPEGPAQRPGGAPVSGRSRRRSGPRGQTASTPSVTRTVRFSRVRFATAGRERTRIV